MRKPADEKRTKELLRRVRRAMDAAGITNQDLARKTGFSPQGISDWFTRNQMPSGDILSRLPAALGVSGHWLLTDELPMEPPGKSSAASSFQMGGVVALETAKEKIDALIMEWRPKKAGETEALERASAAAADRASLLGKGSSAPAKHQVRRRA